MGKYIKKAIGVLFSIGILFFIAGPHTRHYLETAVIEVVAPFLRTMVSIKEETEKFWEYYFQNMESKDRIESLERQVEELQRKNKALEILLSEKGVEPNSLQFEYKYPTVWANIIGYEMIPEPTVAILDKGKNHGIQKNMPVVYQDKVAGKIILVSPNYSKVMFITDPSFALGAMLKDTKEKGLVSGRASGCCEMKFIPTISEVVVGEEILTSGTDGIFPPHLLIGKVRKVDRPKVSKWCLIEVEPAISFHTLSKVQILLKEDELSKILKEFQR